MRIEKLSRKEYREKYGSGTGGMHYITEEGEHVVVFPVGASTRTKLHEIAHAELGHEGPTTTYGEVLRRN